MIASGLVAVAVGIGVGVAAWAVGHPGGSPSAVHSEARVASPAAVAPGAVANASAVLDQAAPNSQIASTTWIGALRTLATARAAVSGTLVISEHPAGSPTTTVAGQQLTFGVSSAGPYSIAFPGSEAFGTADGTQVQIDDTRRMVQMTAGAAVLSLRPSWITSTGELALPNDVVSRVLYPDR
jgi:hypothetical protein